MSSYKISRHCKYYVMTFICNTYCKKCVGCLDTNNHQEYDSLRACDFQEVISRVDLCLNTWNWKTSFGRFYEKAKRAFFLKRRFFFQNQTLSVFLYSSLPSCKKLVNPYSSPWAMSFLTDQRTTRQIRLITSFALANQKIHFLVFLV